MGKTACENLDKTNLDETIVSLSDPAAYDPPPDAVEVVQTHGCCVFLTGRHAYKMKKPVAYAFFDFSTLEKRKAALERELRLNRRLVPRIYEKVVPVYAAGGGLRVDMPADGEAPAEYLLRMQQLPAARFLPVLLASGEAGRAGMERVAERVARFHLGAARGPEVARYGTLPAVREMLLKNADEISGLPGEARPDEETLAVWRKALNRWLDQMGGVITARAAGGFVRDVHGDLRTEHIVLLDEDVVIFDCIDFRDDFRCLDTSHEVASLLMELRQGGYPQAARDFLDAYLKRTEDEALLPLLPMYLLHRMLVRGKVEALKAGAPGLCGRERAAAAESSAALFEAARRAAGAPARPRLILTYGLMASGKSALALGLAEATGAALHISDVLRKEMAGVDPASRHPEAWGAGIYAPRMTEAVYGALLGRARGSLQAGRDAIVDASFSRAADRSAFARMAREEGAALSAFLCVCPDAERRVRLKRREACGTSVSDGRAELMAAQEAAFEENRGENGRAGYTALSTAGPKGASTKEALRVLYLHGI